MTELNVEREVKLTGTVEVEGTTVMKLSATISDKENNPNYYSESIVKRIE